MVSAAGRAPLLLNLLLPRPQSFRQPAAERPFPEAQGLGQTRGGDLAFPRYEISGRASSKETSNSHSGCCVRALSIALSCGLLGDFRPLISAAAPQRSKYFRPQCSK